MELIQQPNGKWYWHIDYRYNDDKDGIGADSEDYDTDRAAFRAVLDNNIVWEATTEDESSLHIFSIKNYE